MKLAIIGIIIRIMYKKAYNNMYLLIAYIYFITVMIYSIRGDLSTVFSALIKQIFLVLFIIFILEKISKSRQRSGINVIYLIALAILYFTHKCSLTTVLICYGLNDIVRIILLMKVYGMRPSLKGLSKKTIASIYRMGIITMLVMLLITINYSVDTIMLKNIW